MPTTLSALSTLSVRNSDSYETVQRYFLFVLLLSFLRVTTEFFCFFRVSTEFFFFYCFSCCYWTPHICSNQQQQQYINQFPCSLWRHGIYWRHRCTPIYQNQHRTTAIRRMFFVTLTLYDTSGSLEERTVRYWRFPCNIDGGVAHTVVASRHVTTYTQVIIPYGQSRRTW